MVAIIPGRAGSKRLPNKNSMGFGAGSPKDLHIDNCMAIAIRTAVSIKNDGYFSHVIVTTDIDNIFRVERNKYSDFLKIKRPPELCQSDSKIIDVIRHALDYFEQNTYFNIPDVCLLQPTSPLRQRSDVINAIKLYEKTKMFKEYHSLYSGHKLAYKTKDKLFDGETFFYRNGAIFMSSRKCISEGKLWDDNVIEFEMPEWKGIDIDNAEDFGVAQKLYEGWWN